MVDLQGWYKQKSPGYPGLMLRGEGLRALWRIELPSAAADMGPTRLLDMKMRWNQIATADCQTKRPRVSGAFVGRGRPACAVAHRTSVRRGGYEPNEPVRYQNEVE